MATKQCLTVFSFISRVDTSLILQSPHYDERSSLVEDDALFYRGEQLVVPKPRKLQRYARKLHCLS